MAQRKKSRAWYSNKYRGGFVPFTKIVRGNSKARGLDDISLPGSGGDVRVVEIEKPRRPRTTWKTPKPSIWPDRDQSTYVKRPLSPAAPGNQRGRAADTESKPRRAPAKTRKPVRTEVDDIKGGPVYFNPKVPLLRWQEPPRGGSPAGRIKRTRVQPTGTGSTKSYFYTYQPAGPRISWKRFKSVLPRQTYQSISSFRLTNGVGLQSMMSVEIMSSASYLSIASAIPTPGTPTAATARMFVKDITVDLMMSNSTNTNTYVEIWDCYFRKNVNMYASTLFSNGLIDTGVPSSPYPGYRYGMDPLKSPSFCHNLKVQHVTSFELGEGRQHNHKLFSSIKAMWSNEAWNTESGNYLKGWTRAMILIARGGPINDATVTTNVSTAPTALDCVLTLKLNYGYYSGNSQYTTLSGSFPTITTPTVVNEGTGGSSTAQGF